MKVPKTVQNNQKFLTGLLTASGTKGTQQKLTQASLPQLKLLVKLIGEVITRKIPLSDERLDKRRIAQKKDYLRQIHESAHIIRSKQQKDKTVVCNLFTPILNLISIFARAVVTHFALSDSAPDSVDNAITTTTTTPSKNEHQCCPCVKKSKSSEADPVVKDTSKAVSTSSHAATTSETKAQGCKRPADATSSELLPAHKKKAMAVKHARDKTNLLEDLLNAGSSQAVEKDKEDDEAEEEGEEEEEEKHCDFC